MLDELRRSTEEDNLEFLDEETPVLSDDEVEDKVERLFLGMTAVERMFVSIFLFMNVLVLGIAFLLATRRITF